MQSILKILILVILLFSGKNVESTFLIEKNSDYNLIENNNSTIDSNLIITGKTNTTSPLEKINNITGYLVIWNSQLDSLIGLRNLKYVGDLSITHNDLLCFVETINWSLISQSKIDVRLNNNTNCSSCNTECIGCWGRSPRLCQKCKNYISGITCVEKCSQGTIIDDNNKKCIEFIPTNVQLPSYEINLIGKPLINIYWNDTYYIPNGVILGYELYVNDIIYSKQIINDIDEIDNIDQNVIIEGTRGEIYKIKVLFLTYVGWSDNNESLYIKIPHELPDPPNITVYILSPYSIKVLWEKTSNEIDMHLVQIVSHKNFTEVTNITESNEIYFDNLVPNENYTVKVKRIRDDLETNFSTTTVTMPNDLPLPPHISNITKVTDNFIQLNFRPEPDLDQIILNNIDHYVCVVIDISNNIIFEQRTLDTKCVLYELDQYTMYKIGVYGVNDYGKSETVFEMIRTKITKSIIFSPEIDVVKDNLLIKVKYSNNFANKIQLKIHDGDNGIVMHDLISNVSLLSEYVNITKKNSYAFQLVVQFVDGSTEESIVTQTYSDFYKKDFEIGGFSKFWLIILLSSIGGILLIIIILLILCKKKNRKIGPINTELQTRKSSIIDSKDYINPIYLDIMDPTYKSTPIYGDTGNNGSIAENGDYEAVDYEDLNLKNPHNLKKNPAYQSCDESF